MKTANAHLYVLDRVKVALKVDHREITIGHGRVIAREMTDLHDKAGRLKIAPRASSVSKAHESKASVHFPASTVIVIWDAIRDQDLRLLKKIDRIVTAGHQDQIRDISGLNDPMKDSNSSAVRFTQNRRQNPRQKLKPVRESQLQLKSF